MTMIGAGLGYRLGKALAERVKKRKLKKGMMKATGQSPTQAAKISQRVDIAAKRKSGKTKPGQKMISAALAQRMMKMKEKKE